MPVKLNEITGLMLEERNEVKLRKMHGDNRAYWYNRAIDEQGTKQIGNNRKRLAKKLYQLYSPHRFTFSWVKANMSFRSASYEHADAIIAAEHELLEYKT